MGWQDYHLYSFEIRGIEFGEPFELDWDSFLDSKRTAIEDLELSTGDTFTYTYDFGDSWEHVITVEGVGVSRGWRLVPEMSRRGASLPTRGQRWAGRVCRAGPDPLGSSGRGT